MGRGRSFLIAALGCGDSRRVRGTVSLARWPAGGELHLSDLLVGEARLAERVVLPVGQQMPEQHGELARDGDERDVMTAASANAFIEGAHWAGSADGQQRGLGQGVTDGAGSGLADPSMVGGLVAGLADGRIQAKF